MLKCFYGFFIALGLLSFCHVQASPLKNDLLKEVRQNADLEVRNSVSLSNGVYHIKFDNPKGERCYAKVVIPKRDVTFSPQESCHYIVKVLRLKGVVDGLTFGRHNFGIKDGLSCFQGQYLKSVNDVGEYPVQLKTHWLSDATILDRISLSTTSSEFEMDFQLALYLGRYANKEEAAKPDFFVWYGWVLLFGLIFVVFNWRQEVCVKGNGLVEHFLSLDSLKGLSCLAVFLIHFNLPGKIGSILLPSCRFAVPLFLCVSGYFLMNRAGQITSQSIKRKARKIALILLLSTFFNFIFVFFCPEFAPQFLLSKNWLSVLGQFVFCNTLFPVVWFLGALIYCYLFMLPFCGEKIKRKSILILLLTLLVGTYYLNVVCVIMPLTCNATYWGGLRTSVIYANLFIFRALPFFLMGVLLRTWEKSIRKHPLSGRWAFLFIFMGFLISGGEMLYVGRVQIYLGCVFSMLVMFVWAISYPLAGNKFLVYLGGKLSLYFYLLHYPVGVLESRFSTQCGFIDYPGYAWLRPFAIFSMTIFLSWSICKTKEKLGKWISRNQKSQAVKSDCLTIMR